MALGPMVGLDYGLYCDNVQYSEYGNECQYMGYGPGAQPNPNIDDYGPSPLYGALQDSYNARGYRSNFISTAAE